MIDNLWSVFSSRKKKKKKRFLFFLFRLKIFAKKKIKNLNKIGRKEKKRTLSEKKLGFMESFVSSRNERKKKERKKTSLSQINNFTKLCYFSSFFLSSLFSFTLRFYLFNGPVMNVRVSVFSSFCVRFLFFALFFFYLCLFVKYNWSRHNFYALPISGTCIFLFYVIFCLSLRYCLSLLMKLCDFFIFFSSSDFFFDVMLKLFCFLDKCLIFWRRRFFLFLSHISFYHFYFSRSYFQKLVDFNLPSTAQKVATLIKLWSWQWKLYFLGFPLSKEELFEVWFIFCTSGQEKKKEIEKKNINEKVNK